MHAREQSVYLPQQKVSRAELLACEAMLADGLKEFLSELAMVNGGIMVSYICNHHHANLDDIIGSSTEHRIKPGRLIYASDAEVDFDWGEAPSVKLAMELRDDRLTAFFHVIFGGDHVAIDLNAINFAGGTGSARDNLRRFAEAVADARVS
jgi:hypothetical protein